MRSPNELMVAVVGAGIVGLATAYQLVKSGARVTLIDRDPEGDKVSFGNAGAIAVTEVMPASAPRVLWRVVGWTLDPLGPVSIRASHAPRLARWVMRFARCSRASEVERISRALAAINARAYDDLLPLLSDMDLTADLQRRGALSLYETEQGYRRDSAAWTCKRARGIEIHEVSGAEARRMEPALGPLVARAFFTPQSSFIRDPIRLATRLRDFLGHRDVAIRRAEVRQVVAQGRLGPELLLVDGDTIAADKVVIAAGVWSSGLAAGIGDKVLLESERGYNSTLPAPGILLSRELIFAERRFVATPLECGLRIGGAAEFGGLHAKPNYRRSAALVELARRYLPELQTDGGTQWAGHRPTTPDSLPVIGRARSTPHVLYAFGHGHLGLTQAATTGALIRDLVFDRQLTIDLMPYDIRRFN
jgi:D-amino-acid dehydrogenase